MGAGRNVESSEEERKHWDEHQKQTPILHPVLVGAAVSGNGSVKT